jgi:hypothetical protein
MILTGGTEELGEKPVQYRPQTLSYYCVGIAHHSLEFHFISVCFGSIASGHDHTCGLTHARISFEFLSILKIFSDQMVF